LPCSTSPQLSTPIQLPRKVLLLMSYAYKPPSYEWLISSVISP
jgi:hypothetical protein